MFSPPSVTAKHLDLTGMRRRASVFHLARANIDALNQRLRFQEPSSWPQHLQASLDLLIQGCNVEDRLARKIVISSARHAHRCAAEISRLAVSIEQRRIKEQCSRAFKLLANNINRLPARANRAINELMRPELPCFDSEILADLLHSIAAQIPARPAPSPEDRVLRAIYAGDLSGGNTKSPQLADLYGALAWRVRSEVEQKLRKVFAKRRHCLAPDEVFSTIAAILRATRIDKETSVADCIVNYVRHAADVWRQHELVPTRGRNPNKPKRRSVFHRFTDLVLLTMTTPEAVRHDHAAVEQMKAGTYHQHILLPPTIRTKVSGAIRRQDVEWLVSDDHVKKALTS